MPVASHFPYYGRDEVKVSVVAVLARAAGGTGLAAVFFVVQFWC